MGSSGILAAGIDLYRFCSKVLVLRETVLVLVIECSQQWCYVPSAHELSLNETKLVRLSDCPIVRLSEHEHEHEHEHESEFNRPG